MNSVVHFEMPYEDRARMVDFYEKAFGWKANLMGPEMGDYAVMHTTEMDSNNMPTKPGRINGGFFKKTPDNQHPSVVIATDNIRETMKKITGAGGKLIDMEKPGEPMDIPGVGLYMPFIDTEGNRGSIIQPKGM